MKEDPKVKKEIRMSREEFDANNNSYERLLEMNINLKEDRSDNMHMIIQNMSKNFFDYFCKEKIALEVYKTQCKTYGIIQNKKFNPRFSGYVQQGKDISDLVTTDKLCQKN